MPQTAPTQQTLNIQEIRDGVLILKDNSLRVVLMASSLNFALKSGEEQTAIVMQYQNFLNSLDFTVQFFIESRAINIEPYIATLRETEKTHTNELLKIQITEYIEFIRTFVRASNIVSKSFYIVVPFEPPAFEGGKVSTGTLKKMMGSLWGESSSKQAPYSPQKFEEYKNQLWQRTNSVIQGLVRAGVRTVPLNTEELIELFYGLYNPGELEKGAPPQFAMK